MNHREMKLRHCRRQQLELAAVVRRPLHDCDGGDHAGGRDDRD